MQQFSSLLSWRLFTAQHVSGVFPPIIRSSMTAVAASGFTFVSWWQSCCVRGRAGRPETCCCAVNKRQDNKLENCCIWLVIYLNFLTTYSRVLCDGQDTKRVIHKEASTDLCCHEESVFSVRKELGRNDYHHHPRYLLYAGYLHLYSWDKPCP